MVVRRFNYTGRKRIKHVDARVSMAISENGSTIFDVSFKLESYNLPGNALVLVEAYRQTSWMRFPFGTVARISRPTDRSLVEFESPESVLFRVRITSATGSEGLILAEADKIRPRLPHEIEEDSIPLLPVRSDSGLGDLVFQVNFDDYPILLINDRVVNWRALVTDPSFTSMVYPVVFREILGRIFYVEDYFTLDDPSDWRSQWVQFATTIPGTTDPPNQDEKDRIDDWIDEVVGSFCRKHNSMTNFKKFWEGEESG